MRYVDVHEAKTDLSKLLEAAESGERIVVTRSGAPVAMLVPYDGATRSRRLGLFAGQAIVHPEFDTLPSDVASELGSARGW